MTRLTAAALLLLAAATAALPARAQKDVVNAKMLGLGAVNILDTYLSAEHYRGTELRFVDHTTRRRPCAADSASPSPWSTVLIHQAHLTLSRPRSHDGREIGGLYAFALGRRYRFALCGGRLTIDAGAQAEAGIGFLYNTRNSNNPAQARLYLDISPAALAAYRFEAWSRPFTVSYEVAAPLVGLMFSPNYGQSYYEIFSRGNYDHNIILTTPFSAPSLRHTLTLDVALGATTLRLGYLGDIRQASVNHLKYHTYSHLFAIGLVRRFQITPRRP